MGRRLLRLRAGSTRPERGDPSCPTGTEGGRGRPHGGRQVHAPEPAATLLRPLGGPCARGRSGRSGVSARRAPTADSQAAAAPPPVPPKRPRPHYLLSAQPPAARDL